MSLEGIYNILDNVEDEEELVCLHYFISERLYKVREKQIDESKDDEW